jgi:uncharacterized protein YcnI
MKKSYLLFVLLLCAVGAHAHVTFEQAKAPAGSTIKAVLRVGHGCEGSATHTLRVAIPAGFRGAKPMPKAGWSLDVRRAALAQPYESHGRQVAEDVVEVTWKANSREAWLADAHYDEFVVRGQLPDKPGALWFKVQQVCERGELNWAEVPTAGTSIQGLKAPAVLLEVTAGDAAGHSH